MSQTENTVRHTKYGRIRGMVVGEGGRSTGVLLYCVVVISGDPFAPTAADEPAAEDADFTGDVGVSFTDVSIGVV